MCKLFTVSFSLLLAVKGFAKSLALVVTVLDGHSIRPESIDVATKMTEKHVNVDQVMTISVKKGEDSTKQLSQKIDSLAKQLGEDDLLKYLILQTHGSSPDGVISSLAEVGQVREDGVDANFREVFSSLVPHAADDLTIRLDSCSVFCGKEESVVRRAKGMLSFFGAPNGAVYGAIRLETSPDVARPRYLTVRSLVPSKSMLVMLYGVAGAMTVPILVGSGDPVSLESLKTSLVASGILGVSMHVAAETIGRSVGNLGSRMGLLNTGYWLEFKDGSPETIEKIKKYFQIEKIHDRVNACLRVLKKLP